MSISIINARDPFCGKSVGGSIAASSSAFDRLRREMLRYCEGEILGRSFLVTGHRGAGKTTTTALAIESVQTEMLGKGVRPLFVPIHGPDLIPAKEVRDAASIPTLSGITALSPQTMALMSSLGSGGVSLQELLPKQPTNPATSGEPSEVVLKQVIVALYRAAAEEYAGAIRSRVLEDEELSEPLLRELLEIAGQLRVELDDAPELTRLYELWKKTNRQDAGILFPQAESRSRNIVDQGILEIIALASAAQAYRVVTGKLTETETSKQLSNLERISEIKTDASLTDVTRLLVGLLTGTLTAGTLLWKEIPALGAVAAGLFAQFALTWTFKQSAKRTRANDRKIDVVFLKDHSVASLDRMVPLLIERFRLAGLAPVFVVDELDKVEKQEDIINVVKFLKHFVTERAFFCFLADRDYAVLLQRESSIAAYPVSYTLFSQRLSILHDATELRTYVGKRFQAQGGESDKDKAASEADLKFLPYVLLHRSRMHMIDLHREIASFTAGENRFNRESGVIRTEPRYCFDVLIQVAVEHVLRGRELASRLRDDPAFNQLAVDAVYYSSRLWETGELVDLSDEKFKAYLATRLGLATDAINLPLTDVELLKSASRQVANYLSAPVTLAQELKSIEVDPVIIDAIQVTDELLTFIPENLFKWKFDVGGRSIGKPSAEEARGRLLSHGPFLRRFEISSLQVGYSLHTLAYRCGILAATPDYTQVVAQRNLLTTAFGEIDLDPRKGRNSPQTEQTTESLVSASMLVRRYGEMLVARQKSVQYALAISAVISRVVPEAKDTENSLDAPLIAVASLLDIPTLQALDTQNRLAKVWDNWPGGAQFRMELPHEFNSSWPDKVSSTLRRIQEIPVDPDEVETATENAWKVWSESLMKSGSAPATASMEDLIASTKGPLGYFKYDLKQMNIGQWSKAMLDCPRAEMKDFAFQNLKTSTGEFLLFLAGHEASIASSWLPDSVVGAAVAKSLEQVREVIERLAETPYILCTEVEPARQSQTRGRATSAQTSDYGWARHCYVFRSPPERPPSDAPFIIAPSGVRDAASKIERAFRLQSTPR